MPKGVYTHKKNRVFSEEHRQKISLAMKGRKLSETRRKIMSESHRGYIMPNDQKEKIRQSMLGKNKGRTHTEETKQKHRVARLGKKASVITKMRLSHSSKGRRHTIETKEKIRQARLGVPRYELRGDNNPMHTHPNSYKSKFGKCGYRNDIKMFVRSRWEANICRIYQYLGYTVLYEPKSFRLSNGKTYRPDFFIKELNLWIEVKGRWLKDAKERFDMFVIEYPKIEIRVIQQQEYKKLLTTFGSSIKMEV
jgi:hypothetical protein